MQRKTACNESAGREDGEIGKVRGRGGEQEVEMDMARQERERAAMQGNYNYAEEDKAPPVRN